MNQYEAESIDIDLAAADAEQAKLKTYLLTPRQFHRMKYAEAVLDDVLGVEVVLLPLAHIHDGAYKAGWNDAITALRAAQRKVAGVP